MNEDVLLVEAINSGDTERFEDLVDAYKDKTYNMCYRFTGDAFEAQDLAQEIFISIFKNLKGFKGQSSLSTWIYRISLNRCIDWHRGQQRRINISSSLDFDPIERLKSSNGEPENTYIKKEQRDKLYQLISQLPEKYKKVIILYHYQHLSYQEIGDILDLPVRTVETHLYRAKKRLKKLLENTVINEVNSYEYVKS